MEGLTCGVSVDEYVGSNDDEYIGSDGDEPIECDSDVIEHKTMENEMMVTVLMR